MPKAEPRFKNVSPLGDLDVPALGRVIKADEEFDVREDLAPLFAGQVANYEPVNTAAKAATAAALAPADGDPEAGDPANGDPEAGDPANGDPEAGDPANETKAKEVTDGDHAA